MGNFASEMPAQPLQPERVQSSAPDPSVIPGGIPDHQLIRCIGRGSYGTVWLARNVIGSWRAVKVVRRDLFSEAGPFEREFAGIQKFEPLSRTHVGLVSILHVGKKDSGDCFYYVMEVADDAAGGEGIDPGNYVAKTLSRELHRRGRLPIGACIRLGMALGNALEHLHQHGLVHCDIKPSNIIFVRGTPKLADAGLVASAFVENSSGGTRGYQAPEGPGAPAADVFSLGKLLYEISTGRDPARFPELPDAPDPTSEEGRLFQRLNEVLLQACEPDRTKRLASASALIAALENCTVLVGEEANRKRRPAGFLPGTASPSPDERKLVTVLVIHLNLRRRFDPERFQSFMRAWMEVIRSVSSTFGAAPVPLGSDGAVVTFGAPAACEDHARRAAQCALAIARRLENWRPSDASVSPADFEVRLGVSSGLAIIPGDLALLQVPALGEPVTVAGRLADLAKPRQILLGEETQRAVQPYFLAPPLTTIRLPEPWQDLRVFSLEGTRPLRTRLQATAEHGLTPYVGRIQELELLYECLEQARAGHGQVVLLAGDAGIGKSRLLFEFRRSVTDAGAAWLEGRSLSFGGQMSYLPIIDLIKRLFLIEDADEELVISAKVDAHLDQWAVAGDWLRPLLRSLLSLPGVDPAFSGMDAQQRRVRTFEGLRKLLLRQAERQPLVLAIEDLHWLDKTSEEFLISLSESLAAAPVLMILSYRREHQDSFPAYPYMRRVLLNPLSRGEMLELASWVLAGAHLPGELEELISTKAEGNPFFVEEILRALVSAGKLRLQGNQCEAIGLLQEARVPDKIQDVIMSRIDRLEPSLRRTLQLASVIGREFGVRLLETIVAPDEPLADSLSRLRDLEFIDERSVFPEHTFLFKHALTQEVAYQSLLLQHRKELHCLVAAATEELCAARLPEFYSLVAYHYERGEEWDRALDYLLRAAERSRVAAAYREEEPLLSRAMAIAERLHQGALLTELRGRRGSARLRIGLWAEAKPDLEMALAELPADQIERRAEWLHDLAGACFWDVDLPRVALCAKEGQSLAVRAGRDDLVAGMLGWLGAERQTEGDLGGAAALYEQALVKGRGFCVASLANYAMVLYWQGRLHEAVTRARESAQMYRNLSDDFALSFAYPHLGLSLAASGRYREAIEIFHQAIHLAEKHQISTFQARSSAMSVGFYLDLFDLTTHERLTQEVRERGMAAGCEAVVVSTSLDLAFNYARRGRVAEATSLLDPIAAGASNLGGWHRWLWELRLLQVRAEIALARHDWDAALDWSVKSIAESQRRGRGKYQVAGRVVHAQALSATGRKIEALAQLRDALSVARSIGDPALLLRAGLAFITLEADEQILAECKETARRIHAELPDEMRTRFQNGVWVGPLGGYE